MRDLLEYLVKNLVGQPEAVKIDEETSDNMVSFNLIVAPEDMGMVIGKGGQTIKSIRRLLITRAMAENQNLLVRVNLQEVAGVTSEAK